MLNLAIRAEGLTKRYRAVAALDRLDLEIAPGEVIGYLRKREITLTWDPAAAALQTRSTETAKTVTVKTN